MPNTQESADRVDIYMRRSIRVLMLVVAVGGAMMLVAEAVFLLRGASPDVRIVMSLFSNLSSMIIGGRISFVIWRHPLLRLDPTEIAWRPPLSARACTLPVAEVTGFRWPLPRDLWIEGIAGATLRIPILGVSAADRERARAWLAQRWADGGFLQS